MTFDHFDHEDLTELTYASNPFNAAAAPSLHPSPVRVARPRLSGLLSRHPEHHLVVVGAPAGCGKTTAVDEWVRSLPDIVVWARAAAPHTASAWPALLGALRRAGLFVDDAQGRCGQHRLMLLAGRIADLPRPVTIVLDGFEVNEPAVADQLHLLLRFASGRLRVVLTARGNPLLRSDRGALAARTELDQVQLAFTDAEAGELFDSLGVDVDDATTSRINHILRGWPVGLHLTARVLASGGWAKASAESTVRHASGIGEYLVTEVLDAQAPDVRRFLLGTAACDVLDPDSALLVSPRGGDILAALPHLNVFLEPVDHRPGRYRYPRFFREMLRAQQTYESRVPHPPGAGPAPSPHIVPDARQRAVVSVEGNRGEEVLIENLTPKELEVLGHLQELLTTDEIAETMFVSVNTVRTHVRNILRKLGVTRRYAAVRRARELGLVPSNL